MRQQNQLRPSGLVFQTFYQEEVIAVLERNGLRRFHNHDIIISHLRDICFFNGSRRLPRTVTCVHSIELLWFVYKWTTSNLT